VLDLFARQVGQRLRERRVARVPGHERQRVRGRLELAVRVVDEHGVGVAHRGGRPSGVGRDLQTQHDRGDV
jgi:hypothetical protein